MVIKDTRNKVLVVQINICTYYIQIIIIQICKPYENYQWDIEYPNYYSSM